MIPICYRKNCQSRVWANLDHITLQFTVMLSYLTTSDLLNGVTNDIERGQISNEIQNTQNHFDISAFANLSFPNQFF